MNRRVIVGRNTDLQGSAVTTRAGTMLVTVVDVTAISRPDKYLHFRHGLQHSGAETVGRELFD